MSIGAITGLASAALPMVGETFKAVTQMAKAVGDLVSNQRAQGDQNRIAHNDSHSHNNKSVLFSASEETAKRSVIFQS